MKKAMNAKMKTFLQKLQTGGLLLLLICGAAFGARGQSDAPVEKVWDRTYGGDAGDQLTSIVATPDGGFLIGGYSESGAGFEKSENSIGFSQDYWIVRVDEQGYKQWDKSYGGRENDQLSCIVATADGGFLLGGNSSSDSGNDKSENRRGGIGDTDFWIVRIDEYGDMLWDKTYGGEKGEELKSIIATSDGGFLLGGASQSDAGFEKSEDSRGGHDYWIVRIDAQGNKLWDRTYGGNGNDQLNCMVSTADGGLMLGGSSGSNMGFEKSEDARGEGFFLHDYWVLRIDEQGNKLWDKTYGGTERDELFAIVATTGGFLLGGDSMSDVGYEKSENARNHKDYWIVRVDAQGNQLWDKTYGGYSQDLLSSMVGTVDGGFLLGGSSLSNAGFDKSEPMRRRDNHDYWLVRVDDQGAKLWDKVYGGQDWDDLNTMLATLDGGFLLGGSSDSRTGFDKSEDSRIRSTDYWVLKIFDLSDLYKLHDVSPQTLAAPGIATLDLYGNPFNENSTVTLFREGQTLSPERYDLLSQYKAQCIFDFAEADTGVWHVAVTFNDTLADTLFDALTVAPLEPFSPCVQVAGPPEARAERWNDYHFAVSNTTNGDRQGVPLWLALPGKGAEVKVSFRVADGNPLDTAWQDLDVNWPYLDQPLTENPDVLPLYLPYLPAGKTITLRVRVKANFGSDRFKLKAWTNNLMSGEDFERLGLGCMYVALTAVGAEAVPQVVAEIGTLEEWRQCAAQAAIDVQRDLRLLALDWHKQPQTSVMTQQQFYFAAAMRTFACMGFDLNNAQKTRLVDAVNAMLNYGNLVAKEKPTEFKRCGMLGLPVDQKNFPCIERYLLVHLNERNGIDADRDSTLSEAEAEFMRGLTEPCLHASYLFSPVCEAELAVAVVASYDPNNKVGVKGAGANGYLPELQPFKYVINYENKPDATAPAQEVFIYDTLDAEVFDLETFRFGAVGFNDTIVEPVVYPDSMKAEIDLRPEQPYIVRVSGKVNRSFDAVAWHFETLDPETMELITDPRGGFLPPNQTSPEGQGFVFFTIEPKEDLPTGTELRNDAKIVFDLNPPIFTEPWINTLDQVKPVSEAAAEIATDSTISLTWSGTDEGSGVAHYTLYMSVDDSAYVPVLWQTERTAAELLVATGHTYRFYSLATDAVNNVEDAPDFADAEIIMEIVTGSEALHTAGISVAPRPNPFSGATTFVINLENPADLTLELRDVTGRLVATERFFANTGETEHTFDASGLSAGAYFYTIKAADGRKAEGKLIAK